MPSILGGYAASGQSRKDNQRPSRSQQSSGRLGGLDVRFGSFADIQHGMATSALHPKADIQTGIADHGSVVIQASNHARQQA
jgi:hypothetical protein